MQRVRTHITSYRARCDSKIWCQNCVTYLSNPRHTPSFTGPRRRIRCCGKSLIGSALVKFNVRQHARRESISKRASSTTRTSLHVFRIALYRLVTEPANANCVRPLNVLRSLSSVMVSTRKYSTASAASSDRCASAWPSSRTLRATATLAVKDGPHVTLFSRSLKDATAQYVSGAAVAQIRDGSARLDGDIVTIDEHRRPSLQALRSIRSHSTPLRRTRLRSRRCARYAAFDGRAPRYGLSSDEDRARSDSVVGFLSAIESSEHAADFLHRPPSDL